MCVQLWPCGPQLSSAREGRWRWLESIPDSGLAATSFRISTVLQRGLIRFLPLHSMGKLSDELRPLSHGLEARVAWHGHLAHALQEM